MSCVTKIIGDLLPSLIELLPDKAPGISADAARTAIGTRTSEASVRTALTVLERDGIAVSHRATGPNGMPAWLFHRASEDDDFEDATLVYGDGET